MREFREWLVETVRPDRWMKKCLVPLRAIWVNIWRMSNSPVRGTSPLPVSIRMRAMLMGAATRANH
jgi:hypothetical protein